MATKKAPVRRRRRAPAKTKTRRGTKKTMISKAKKFATPGGALAAFLAPYMKKSKETGTSITDLIKADIENFNTAAATARLKANAAEIAAPIGAGLLIKELKPLGKYSGITADLLTGIGVGTLGKTILDPPSSPNSLRTARGGTIIEMEARNGGRAMQRNPYEVV